MPGSFIDLSAPAFNPATPKPRGLLPVPPEVAEEVAREEARISQTHGFQIAPEARKLMTDTSTLYYYYEGSKVACRTTPEGVEVFAVGGEEIHRFYQDTPPEAAQLPSVVDERARSTSLGTGTRLDPVDVDAATRLASLSPVQVGSSARKLAVVVTDDHGYEPRAQPEGWTAIFGFHTPSLRRPDIIPGQGRLLGRLLEGREASIASIVLADEHDGTYVARPSPSPTPKPE